MKNQENIITLLFLIGLVIFNIWMIGTGSQPWIISSLNIFFHEAGHFIFSFFGHFIMVLGGTLGELLMPSSFLFYFWRHQRLPGQVFSLWWITTALYGIAIYMADARARVLPLVGGDPAGHDWWYLLRTTGLLDYDVTLSKVVIVIALSLTWYMIVLIHKYWESIKDGINFEIFT